MGRLLSGVGPTGQLFTESIVRLGRLFDEELSLRLDGIQTIHPRDLKKVISQPAVLGVLSAAPQKARGFVEVELSIAHVMVDLLLGGAGDVVALRPLTEIEEGVLTFVLVEALRALSPYVQAGLPRLKLESLVHGLDEVLPGVVAERQVVALQLRLAVGGRSGYVRLYLPESVAALAVPPLQGPERKAQLTARARAHMGARLKGVTGEVRIEIGGFQLESGDFQRLKQGDVIKLDEGLNFRPDKGQPGPAKFRLGLGRAGHVELNTQVHQGRYHGMITAIVGGDDMHRATEKVGPGGEPVEQQQPKSEGAELLGDIPMQITIELGRMHLSAEEIVGLHVGQVLDLKRPPNEPVQLSVKDRVVARGELVEVEGQIGVRILSLVR